MPGVKVVFMEKPVLKSDLLLLLAAGIWGFAFIAQRVGMAHMGPFAFNGVRFALGAMALLPFILRRSSAPGKRPPGSIRKMISFGLMAGIPLFLGASLQQVGLVYTTAGNAGFITGLYVVIVPVLGLFLGKGSGAGTWVGAVLAAAGLYLLSAADTAAVSFGDLLVFAGAFFWAGHVLVIGWLSPRMDPLGLAAAQFSVCALLSLATAFLFEDLSLYGLYRAALPIVYGGVFSVGIAYTLQVVAQRDAPPAHAAILLSLEAVFAAFGGWLILDEIFTAKKLSGCLLMLSGMLLSQLVGSEKTYRKTTREGIPASSAVPKEPTSSRTFRESDSGMG
jgi:drug/metabolite transporter (DMT)-like permease